MKDSLLWRCGGVLPRGLVWKDFRTQLGGSTNDPAPLCRADNVGDAAWSSTTTKHHSTWFTLRSRPRTHLFPHLCCRLNGIFFEMGSAAQESGWRSWTFRRGSASTTSEDG